MTTPAKTALSGSGYVLDLRAPYRRHCDRDQFIVLVLWLAGLSASNIASAAGMRRSQILGIVHRSSLSSRSAMTDAERQTELDDLHAIRTEDATPLDGSALDRFDWKILPLADGRKRRPGRAR